jgi:hypothetical protein
MESLFRLALARPAVDLDPANPSIKLQQDSPLQKDLATAFADPTDPRAAIQKVLSAFVTRYVRL